MYDNVQTFAFSNIDKFSTASIVTRLTTDVTNIQNAYQMLRDSALKIIRALGVKGGCNVQFALDPHSFRYYVIEAVSYTHLI